MLADARFAVGFLCLVPVALGLIAIGVRLVRRSPGLGWRLLAVAACGVVAILMIGRIDQNGLRRDTVLGTREPQVFLVYWAAVAGLAILAGWAVERSRPGFWQRRADWLRGLSPGGRALVVGVGAFVGVLFATWAMFGNHLFPVAFVFAAMAGGTTAAAARRPIVVPPREVFADPAVTKVLFAPLNRLTQRLLYGAAAVFILLGLIKGDSLRGDVLAMYVFVWGLWAVAVLAVVGAARMKRILAARAKPAVVPLVPAPAKPPVAHAPGSPKVCPKCAAAVAADSPFGLCPKCLLNVALASVADPRRTSPYSDRFTPPAVDEVQEFFPQLQVIELVGVGGMGAVYKVRQPGLDRYAALKLIRPREDDPTFAERFAREAKALARLAHPNIVTVYETGESGGSLYLLMEYVDGVTLREPMRAKTLAPAQALAVIGQICTALQFAHEQGVVHRDIKPENILLDKSGKVKIADFGLAKVADADAVSLTRTQQAMGTPHYMAPEQWERPAEVDHRADMYALGVVLYELLTGELPLGRFDPPSRRAAVAVGLDEVVLRLLEKDPGRRYQRAADAWTAVERAGVGKPQPTGWAWRSKTTLFGWPLVDVNFRNAVGSGEGAKGWLAIGNRAVGLVAVGVVAFGGLAVGPMAIGLLAVGAFAFGGLAAGAVGVGAGAAVGGLAVAPFAAGGGAAGYYVHGGTTIGEMSPDGYRAVPWADVPGHIDHYFEEASNPQFAKHPGNPWRPNLIAQWLFPYLGPGMLVLALAAVAVSIGSSKLRDAGRRRAAVHLQGGGLILLFVGGFLAAMFTLPFPLLVPLWMVYGPLLFGLIFWFNRELAGVRGQQQGLGSGSGVS